MNSSQKETMRGTKPLIRAEGLHKTFLSGEEEITVLSAVDFILCEGERVSICGESGCGKSTLLNVLSGLEDFQKGSLFWDGEAVNVRHRNAALAQRRGRLIGFVFQAFYLVPELNAIENVLLPARIAGNLNKASYERAEELMRRVGLEQRLRHSSTKLSGGERQRVAVARALINQPPVLFADEPTGNLDERSGDAVMDLIEQLSKEEGTSLVLVTHSADYAARMERTLHLTRGGLVRD